MDTYKIPLSGLGSGKHIVAAQLVGTVSNQLCRQGRTRISRYRYAVDVEIVEGKARPAKDLDNYAKPILDALTQSRLLWADDNQIDELVIRRRRDGNSPDSVVRVTLKPIEGQHGGIPNRFRGRILEARQGGGNYSNVGYFFAKFLARECPYDLEEEDWQDEIASLIDMLDADEIDNVWNWCREHFPRWMDLVPGPRKNQFLRGVQKAHENEKIGE